ncbi:universal stress protein [Fundidesulfovibrio butyratiphilus]
MIRLERVLAPVDGSPSSINAVKYATNLVAPWKATLYLLHVWHPLPMSIGGDQAETLRREHEAEAMALLDKCRTMIEPCSIPVERLARPGRAEYVILDIQQEYDCDLIVMGSRGLTPLQGFFLGSVAVKVLHGATCPVLVTRSLRDKYLVGSCTTPQGPDAS